jgi:hypothetical protein
MLRLSVVFCALALNGYLLVAVDHQGNLLMVKELRGQTLRLETP